MNTDAKQDLPIEYRTRRGIDRSVRFALTEMEDAKTLMAETPNGLLQRLLKLYTGIKPLLVFLSTFKLFPATWRTALVIFNEVLEALARLGPDITAQFKAGRDL